MFHGIVQKGLGPANGIAWAIGQTGGILRSGAGQLHMGHDPIDQPAIHGLIRAKAIPQKGNFLGLFHANKPRKGMGRTAIGRCPDMDISQCENGILGSNGKVAGIHQTNPKTRNRAIEFGNHRTGQGGNAGNDVMDLSDHVFDFWSGFVGWGLR